MQISKSAKESFYSEGSHNPKSIINCPINDLVELCFAHEHCVYSFGTKTVILNKLLSSQLLAAVKLIPANSNHRQVSIHLKYSLSQRGYSSSLYTISTKLADNSALYYLNPFDSKSVAPKLGDLVYVYFYFSSQYLYNDSPSTKLILSQSKKSVFKIIEHCPQPYPGPTSYHRHRSSIRSQTLKDSQPVLMYIADVYTNTHKYQLVLAYQPTLYVKQLGQYLHLSDIADQMTIISFDRSIYSCRILSKYDILTQPCNLQHIESKKYITYNDITNQLGLTQVPAVLTGLFKFETQHSINEQSYSRYPYIDTRGETATRIRIIGMNNMNKYLTHLSSRGNINMTHHSKSSKSFSLFNQILTHEDCESLPPYWYQLSIEDISLYTYKSSKIIFTLTPYTNLLTNWQVFITSSSSYSSLPLYLHFEGDISRYGGDFTMKTCTSTPHRSIEFRLAHLYKIYPLTKQMILPYLSIFFIQLHLYSYRRKVEQYSKLLDNRSYENIYSGQSLLNRANSKEQRHKLSSQSMRSKVSLDNSYITAILRQLYNTLSRKCRQSQTNYCKNFILELFKLGIMANLEEILYIRIVSKFYTMDVSTMVQYQEDYTYLSICQIVGMCLNVVPSATLIQIFTTPMKMFYIRLCYQYLLNQMICSLDIIVENHPLELLERLQTLMYFIEDNFEKSKAKLGCILVANRIMQQYNIKFPYFEGLLRSALANVSDKLNDTLMIVLKLIKILHGNQYTNNICNKQLLTQCNNEQLPFHIRYYYAKWILLTNSNIVLPLVIYDGVKLTTYLGYSYPTMILSNQYFIHSQLEDVLPKNCRFYSPDNKFLAFLACRYWLEYNQDTRYPMNLENTYPLEYFPMLVNYLSLNIDSCCYEGEDFYRFIVEVLSCLSITIHKYIQTVAQYCLSDRNDLPVKEQTASCLKWINCKIKPRAEGDDLGWSKLSAIINKYSVWKLFNESFDDTAPTLRSLVFNNWQCYALVNLLSICDMVFNPNEYIIRSLHEIFLLPVSDFEGYNKDKLSKIIKMLINNDYREKTEIFVTTVYYIVDKLTESSLDALIAIINRNKMITYFFESFENSASSSSRKYYFIKRKYTLNNSFKDYNTNASRNTAYRLIDRLLLHHRTNIRSLTSLQTFVNLSSTGVQIPSHPHFNIHELAPARLIDVLMQLSCNYSKEEILLHTHLIHAMGVMTSMTYFGFYERYLIGYYCRKYNICFLELILEFMNSLTPNLKTKFCLNYDYALSKQINEVRDMIASVGYIKSLIPDILSNYTTRKSDSHNILVELYADDSSFVSVQQHSDPLVFLITYFKILLIVAEYSSNSRLFLFKLGYRLLFTLIVEHVECFYLKINVIKFFVASLDRHLHTKQYVCHYTDYDEDYDKTLYQLVYGVKYSTYFVRKYIQFLKKLKATQLYYGRLMKYLYILIRLIKLRTDAVDHYTARSRLSSNFYIYEYDDDYPMESTDKPNKRKNSFSKHNLTSISELYAMKGIDKLLAFELIDLVYDLLKNREASPTFYELLQWMYTNLKISTNNVVITIAEPEKKIIYKLDKSVLFHDENNQMESNKYCRDNVSRDNQLINGFLSANVPQYIVLLVECLYSLILTEQNRDSQRNNYEKSSRYLPIKYIYTIRVLELLYYYLKYKNERLSQYWIANPKLNQVFGAFNDYGFNSNTSLTLNRNDTDKANELYITTLINSKTVSEYTIQKLFNLLLYCHNINSLVYLTMIHCILDNLVYENLHNLSLLQTIIGRHSKEYLVVMNSIIDQYKTISPLLDDRNYVFIDALYSIRPATEVMCDIRACYGNSDLDWVTMQFYILLKFMITMSKSLNLPFKYLFSQYHIFYESVLGELIDVLRMSINNLTYLTYDKLELIKHYINLINTLMHGPVYKNIQVALNKHYDSVLLPLLHLSDIYMEETLRMHVVSIKKYVMEALSLLPVTLHLKKDYLQLVEKSFEEAFCSSYRLYTKGNFNGIIAHYSDPSVDQDISLLHFDLALSSFYCLIKVYEKTGDMRIRYLQYELLSRRYLQKAYAYNLKIFYQIYRLFAYLIDSIMSRIRMTYLNQPNQSSSILYNRALKFFADSVSSVDVQVSDGKIYRVYFLLLKYSKCYNVSIRKYLHRLVGLGKRHFRLSRLMSVSKYIILRLYIQKNVLRIMENFKPLEMIVHNRQLWKSMNFLMTFLINFVFLFEQYLYLNQPAFLEASLYLIRASSGVFCLFLFIIYFVEVLPLKIRVGKLTRSSKTNNFKYILFLLDDKTLWFALIYTIVISISYYHLAFVALLMLDFFVRFKVSRKVTIIITKPLLRIIYIIFTTVTIIYITALFVEEIGLGIGIGTCDSPLSCTQQYFLISMNLLKNLSIPTNIFGKLALLSVLPRFVLRLLTSSLIIGVMLSEKRRRDEYRYSQAYKITKLCFICDAERSDIDRTRNSNKGFFNHVYTYHNLWNYVFYLAYLKNKQRNNLNSVEMMIVEQWESNKFDWLPDRISP